MGFAGVGNHLGESGLTQPARGKTAQNTTRLHVQTEVERRLRVFLAPPAALARHHKQQPQLPHPGRTYKCDKSAVRIAFRHAVQIESRLRIQLAAAKPLSGIAINSNRAPRKPLWRLRSFRFFSCAFGRAGELGPAACLRKRDPFFSGADSRMAVSNSSRSASVNDRFTIGTVQR